MNEEYDDDYVEQDLPVAPPPHVPKQWSWSPQTMMWAAVAVVGAGFGIWFLMAYTNARSAALAEGASNDNAGS